MLRAFWTWAPRPDEKWFFDKSVWQKMFRAMSGCGFNALILANARLVGEDPAAEFDEMRRWILSTTLDYDIASYLAINLERDLGPIEQAGDSLRALLETYPEIKGVFVDMSGGAELVQHIVVDTLDAARPDASLYLRGECADPKDLVEAIKRRGNRRIGYSVKYSGDHLVDASPDPQFGKWIEAADAGNIAAEFGFANFEPWTSFSYDAVEGILANLDEAGCDGFSLKPLSLYEWPHTSDAFFKHQWQRDMVWYSVWGGTSVERLARQGLPKWLVRNAKLVPGFEAGSRILELLALYFAGDKTSNWHPQFCSIGDEHGAHLMTIDDMLHLDDLPAFAGRNWWEEITGDPVVHLGEYIESGTTEDAYGPEELIEELTDLSQQAVASGEKGMRSASGEKELPSFSRDALCMGRLGEFYIERLRAALSHARGEDAEAIEHMTRALGLYREICAVDSSHRDSFRVVADGTVIEGDWTEVVKALEREHADALNGVFGRGAEYRM
jgi:hypothetical protein